METADLDIDGCLVRLDDVPLSQVVAMDETVLANSLRRVVDAAARQSSDAVAAFNNYI